MLLVFLWMQELGDAVYDVFGSTGRTAGSQLGRAFTQNNPVYVASMLACSGAVGGGVAPVGDLYCYLNLRFDRNFTSDNILSFKADSDNLLLVNDINPIPEQGALLVTVSGLLVLVDGRPKND